MRVRYLLMRLIVIAAVALSPGLTSALTSQVQILKLEVPPGLPASPTTLAALAGAIRLQAVSGSVQEGMEAKLVVQIRQAGALQCGNAPATGIAVAVKKQMLFDGTVLSRAWSSCSQLAPGAYTICAQFYTISGEPLSEEACAAFTVAATEPAQEYTAPVLLTPQDGSFELEERFRTGVRFSWKGVAPSYPGPVTYRLRIWKIGDGQDAAGAISNSKPVLTRDLIDATEITLANALPVPCAAGKQCRFAWNVQALNALGDALGPNNGTSPAAVVAATTYAIQLDKISVLCTSTQGVYSFSFSLTNPNLGPAKLTNFLVTSSLPAGASITTFSPPLNTTITAGSQITVTGTITAAATLTSICIGAQITDASNTFWQASKDTCIPVKPCKCEACDPKKVDIKPGPNVITVNANNTVTLSQPFSITTTPLKLVKAVDMELVYFSFAPDNDDCMPCNKDSRTYGNFLAGTIGNLLGTGNGTHGLGWTFSPPKNGSGVTPFGATISLPPMVKCCDATLRFCVRYVITFADCSVCYKLVCYEKRLDGCSGSSVPSTPNN